jgi:hypothetical protein
VEDAQLEQLSCIAPAKRKGGQTSDVWQLFSTDESPQLLRSACCMHCKDALFESATVGCVLAEENADEMSKQKEQLFIQYTNWVLMAEINDFHYRMLKKRAKTSLQYWQVDGAEFPAIRAVALTVFSMVASSAASERVLSTMFIQRCAI